MKIKLFFLIFFVLLFVSCSSSRKISSSKKKKETITESPYKTVAPVKQVQHVKKLQKSNKSLNKYSLQYIKRYAPIAVSEMHKYNVPASITLAQGILESGNGRSQLASKSNNHFGIKCHTGWKGAKVYHDDDEKGGCTFVGGSWKDVSTDDLFKDKKVELILNLSEGQVLALNNNLKSILNYPVKNDQNYSITKTPGYLWKMGTDGLECLNCPQTKSELQLHYKDTEGDEKLHLKVDKYGIQLKTK